LLPGFVTRSFTFPPEPFASMTSPQVDLKNRWLAAVLAFLIPGAGHLYQGRLVKAAIYSVGIIGLFVGGMVLGEWKVVYWRWEPGGHRSFGYFSQVLVGLPALPARWQAGRYLEQGRAIDETLDAPFSGRLRYDPDPDQLTIHPVDPDTRPTSKIHEITGTIHWQREAAAVTGTLEGTLDNGQAVSLTLIREPMATRRVFVHDEITPSILRRDKETSVRLFSSTARYVRCDVQNGDREGIVEGTVPRDFWNWFQVPLEEEALQELHGRLGRRFELAQVFTWIAGLLNLLAIWDALEGPAYGYGDEEDDSEQAAAD
jgi:hypothetical protein